MQRFATHRHLSADVQILLNNLAHAYDIGVDHADYSHIERYTSSATLSQFINDETRMHESLIYFYKNIPQFAQHELIDQIRLVKSNQINLIHLHHIIVEQFRENSHIGVHMSRWIDSDFHQQMTRTREKFDCFMMCPLVMKLALVVFVFSTNLSMPRITDEFIDYKDPKAILDHQTFFISLLWKYLNIIFNEDGARRSMQTIVMQILRYQTLMIILEDKLSRINRPDAFNPLMQSICRLN
jgi:hypothetical protein